MSVSLVYHGGALGDFLTALPAMAAWRRQHQGARLVLLGKPAFAELAPRGLFDEVWDAESQRFSWLFGTSGDSRTSARLPAPSVSSALLFSSASSPLPANLTRAGVPSLVRQDPIPAAEGGFVAAEGGFVAAEGGFVAASVQIVDYHLSLFSGVSFSEEERVPVIARGPASVPVSPHAAALHPGSGSPRKNWPLARFVTLSRLLAARGFHVTWITGPAEDPASLPEGAAEWRDVPLPHLAAALSLCELYVGNDSGITHLAAAAGCATIALFGPTNPAVWAPRGRSVQVVVAPEKKLELLDEETVFGECCLLLRK